MQVPNCLVAAKGIFCFVLPFKSAVLLYYNRAQTEHYLLFEVFLPLLVYLFLYSVLSVHTLFVFFCFFFTIEDKELLTFKTFK